MTTIRVILATAIIALGMCSTAIAQNVKKSSVDCQSSGCYSLVTVALQNHTCTAACKNGKHDNHSGETATAVVYTPTPLNGVAIKKHVCNDGCKNGKHNYNTGEMIACLTAGCKSINSIPTKQHVCNDGCKNGTHHYLKGEVIAVEPCNTAGCKSLIKTG